MATSYSIQQVSKLIGEGQSLPFHDETISYLSIDSRKLFHPEHTLFFALKGANHDGHIYIDELIERGVRNFVVSNAAWLENKQANFIFAPNSQKALQGLAGFHRQQFHYPVLGITGSNGKTIIKEWLSQLLDKHFKVVKSPRSYNSQVGVPLSVWQMKPEHNLGIFEAGISKPGEMNKLSQIIEPTLGLFTNLGDAHSENFTNKYNKALEKAQLFQSCESIFYCADHEIIPDVIEQLSADKNLISGGYHNQASLQIQKIETTYHTQITALYKQEEIQITLPFVDPASIENCCHVWNIGLHLGLSNETIQDEMKALAPIAMRLEVKKGLHNTTIVNDVYNSDLGSLEIALEVLQRQTSLPKRTLILSDILQSDISNDTLSNKLNELIESFKIERFFGIGPKLSSLEGHIHAPQVITYENTVSFLKDLHQYTFQNESILVKGARDFRLERVCQRLEERIHETRMEINLNALIHNLNYFRSKLKPETKLMTMVKASSYGSGAVQIAKLLEFHRVDYLAVAYADEGVELREAGVNMPIMVVSPEMKGFEQMIIHRLEPEVFSFKILESFSRHLKNIEPELLPFPIHIKLDTGMHRLGFEESELEELAYELKSIPEIEVKSIFSHLAGSEDPMHDDFTQRQIRKFDSMTDILSNALGYQPMKHILNTSGISRHTNGQYDMARLGIGLYGIGSNVQEDQNLLPVISFKSEIIQTRLVPAGDSIGYGRREVTTKPTKIGIISLGYADGLSRMLGNRNSYLLVNGQKAPIVGNVCMDLCMVDLTGIDAEVGAEVEVFGENRSVRSFANDLHTIPYEVFASTPARVKRIYFQE